MRSLQVNSIKTIVSENVKCFSVGSFLVYEQVDSFLGISEQLRSAKIKVKGVDLADITKTLVCGVIDGKKSVKAIFEDSQTTGKSDYVNPELSDTVLKTFYRGIQLVGVKGKENYDRLTNKFQEKTKVKMVQGNFDYTSSYFEGIKAFFGKQGYSRDHRPDLKQLKVGLFQVDDELFSRTYFFDSGEKTDVTQFREDFLKAKEMLSPDTLIVVDRGIADPKNLSLISGQEFKYLAGLKKGKAIKSKILDLKKEISKLEKVEGDKNYSFFKEEHEGATRFYFYSQDLFQTQQARKKKKFAKKYKEINESKKKTKIKEIHTGLENIIVTQQTIVQKRLVKKTVEELEKSFLEKTGCFDGWFVLETNQKDMTAKDALEKYKRKDSVEKVICSLKQNCKLRPFNVRKEDSIKGSLFISMLANLVIGVFSFLQQEHLKGKSPRTIIDLVKNLTVDLFYNPTGQIIQKSFKNFTDILKKIFSIPTT